MSASVQRQVNLLKATYSYLRSTINGNPEIMGLPVTINVELTNNCNLKCPQCLSGSGDMQRGRGYMKPELFQRIISELKPGLYTISLYFQGEPMLHPDFFEFLGYCRGINSVVSTNGHFLTPDNCEKIVLSGLRRIIVSVDGIDQQTYSAYRVNGNLSKVVDGLDCLCKTRKQHHSSLKTEIQVLVNRNNENQIPLIKKLARSVDASVKLKSMQIIRNQEISSWLPSARKFRRYRIQGNEFVIKSSLPDRCGRLWFNPVITWDGKVLPCCFDKDAEYVMGDLAEESFEDIWNGPKFRMFRKSILTGRHMIDICNNCTSGLDGAAH